MHPKKSARTLNVAGAPTPMAACAAGLTQRMKRVSTSPRMDIEIMEMMIGEARLTTSRMLAWRVERSASCCMLDIRNSNVVKDIMKKTAGLWRKRCINCRLRIGDETRRKILASLKIRHAF